MENTFLSDMKDAIADAERDGRLLTLEGVTGLSGDKLVGLLQRSARLAATRATACYLEIGVFQGLTLTSVAAAAPSLPCFGIDNFSQFDSDGRNKGITQERLSRHTKGNGHLINADFEDALLGLREHIHDQRIAVYFIDGPHDYRSQYLCLDFARPYLADDVVILVDDANYEHVRRATADWLKANQDFALLYESYSPSHPNNMNADTKAAAQAGWWDGINVIVRDPGHRFGRIYPPVADERERYFNDHLVHSARHAELAPRLLQACTSPLPMALARVARLLLQRPAEDRFRTLNTYSGKLTTRTAPERSGD